MNILDELYKAKVEDLCATDPDPYMPCPQNILKDIQDVVDNYKLVDENGFPLKLNSNDIACNSKLIKDRNGVIENSVINTFF